MPTRIVNLKIPSNDSITHHPAFFPMEFKMDSYNPEEKEYHSHHTPAATDGIYIEIPPMEVQTTTVTKTGNTKMEYELKVKE